MSIINKMLQDLDRRQAGPGKEGAVPHVQAIPREPHSREWFWRTLAVLIVIALAWVAWVAYQMWPRPIATDLAYKTADEARSRAALASRAAAPKPVPPMPAEVSAPVAPEPASPGANAKAPPAPPEAAAAASERAAAASKAATPPAPAALPERLRLAQSIETPIAEAAKRPAAGSPKPSAPKVANEPAAHGAVRSKVERRDRVTTPAERAENEFRYAAAVLKLGRSGEAEAHFGKALELDAGHRGARQALVAMDIERGQLQAARQLLEEGLRIDPAQPEFAIALARILIERKDPAGALSVLDAAAPAAADMPDFHVLRATVLQRLGRHAEAAEAYRVALRQQSALPQAWVGLGISLEALQQRRQAADAFRQALLAGPVNADVKAFAEQRIRALH